MWFLVVAAVAAIIGTGYSVHSQNMATKSMSTAQGRQNLAQAKQLELQAAAEKTQATADELDRQQTLKRIFAAQNAVFGSSGADPMSANFSNIQTADAQKAMQAKNLNQIFTDTRQVGIQNNIASLGYDSQMSRMAGKFTRRANTISGINSIISMAGSGAAAYAKK